VSELDEIAQGFGFGDHPTMVRLLAARGLHIVSAADKAVLDACADLAMSTCVGYQRSTPFRFIAQLELARRLLSPSLTVHLLSQGQALCGKPGPPSHWATGHRWVAADHDELGPRSAANCAGCLAAREAKP
jgi:hypothetical protein